MKSFSVLGRSVCGGLLLLLTVLLHVLDPLRLITRYMMRVEEGSSVFLSFQKPDYTIHQVAYIFNYTNTERYLQGLDTKLKIEEIGPFVFQAVAKGLNMSVDHERKTSRKTLKVTPEARLVFIPELSVARMEDVRVVVPNLVMIVLGTIGADTLPSWSNSLVAFLMRSMNSKLFLNMTAEQILWGYNDPLVDLAAKYFPGWIDFSAVGILKMFYSSRPRQIEMEAEGENAFAILNMEGSLGLKEQGYDGPGTENLCNTINSTYAGMMISPDYPRDKMINLFSYQGCRVYPMVYEGEGAKNYGVPYNRYVQHPETFKAGSRFACSCGTICPPDGLVDTSHCYYGFPVYISPPHFYRSDPKLLEPFEGLTPDKSRANSYLEFDPMTGVPLDFSSNSQTNLRVHVSPYNSEMAPLGRVEYLPVIWLRLTTPYGASDSAVRKLRILHVYGSAIELSLSIIMLVASAFMIASAFRSFVEVYRRRASDAARARQHENDCTYMKIKCVNES